MSLREQLASLRGGQTTTERERAKEPRTTPWQYLKGIREELSKVNWPKRKEVVQGTISVLIVSAIFIVILGGFDMGFQRGLDRLLSRELPATVTPEAPAEGTLPSVESEIPAEPAPANSVTPAQ
jgi:preprotein translocase SecE subunit